MMSISSWTGTAEAQTSDRFPGSVQIDIQGERHQAFSLGGFTELLRIDAELLVVEAQVRLLDRLLNASIVRWTGAQTAHDLCMEQVDTLQTERTRLMENWTEENRLRLDAENSLNMGWVGFGLAAVFAITTAIFAAVITGGGV